MFESLETYFRGNALLFSIAWTAGMGFVLFGYDDGVLGSLLSAPSFEKQFHYMNSAVQGTVTGLFFVGAGFGALAASVIGDRYGRKAFVHAGAIFIDIGAILQCASYGIPQLMVGRVVAGIGLGLITSRVPIWQAETAPPRIRGTLIGISLSFLIIGSIIAYWFEYGLNYASGDVVWRLPIAFQIVLSLIITVSLFFTPESPRWLVEHGQIDRARTVFAALLDKEEDDDEVTANIQSIEEAMALEKASQMTWKQIFSKDDVGTRQRFIAAFLCQFLQPFSGSTTINYYATTIYEESVNMSRNLALLMSGFTMLWFLIASFGTWYLLERFGRRRVFMGTGLAMAIVMAIIAGLIKVNTEKAGIGATVCIFIYETFYTWGWMANCWTYPSEILPLGARSKGMGLSSCALYWFSFVILQVTPPGLANIGYKMYIIYAIFNLCFVPIAYFLFPETAGLKLEDVDRIYLQKKTTPIKAANEIFWGRRKGNIPDFIEKAEDEHIEKASHNSTEEKLVAEA